MEAKQRGRGGGRWRLGRIEGAKGARRRGEVREGEIGKYKAEEESWGRRGGSVGGEGNQPAASSSLSFLTNNISTKTNQRFLGS